MKKQKSVIKYIVFVGIYILSVSSYGQDLQTYIDEAISNSPEIQKFQLRYDISSEKVNEANWIPNTEISAGYFVSETETRVGAQRARFSVKQMLPWFGTITARENYASSMAEADYVEVTIAKRKLALSVSQFYYQLYEINAKQLVLDQNIELLKTYERLALTSVEVGKASAVDVLRLQIRQNELQQEKEVLTQQSKGFQAAVNSLLNRDYDNDIVVVDTLEMPIEDIQFSYDALSLNPELLKYDKLYESVTQSELLNLREAQPMFGFGLDYIPVSARTDMNVLDSGKDILMPMVSISIPIFNNRYKSITKQNDLRQQEIQSQKDERLNFLESELAKAISQRNQARIKFNTQQKNLEQAEDAEEILIKNYETGTIDFNDVLDIQELQLKFQMSQIESVKSYYVQSALINYLIN
ncbi:TolC family protein [Arenibacter sp. ARW7G5Y1]|uniref:TolC family protein n=1 Tax=Arenibacter sp. ARW7G5Y1 TaxID=2135619 RepID=UPI000D775FB4|nr:TolC family protein [Arenibacter sp. ARW7G5Y1]PXX28168.1 outer membrane protein TolC [Arenibacter sp. ARW7G5Y1]|tara:strand:- start:1192 stop:2427 length:1236 start_codon:yes stop_codon:yes gene_type:complete